MSKYFTLIMFFLFSNLAVASTSTTDYRYNTVPDIAAVELKYFDKQKDHLLQASKLSGVEMTTATAIASLESGLGRNTKNPYSYVKGVMQYKQSTWNEDVKRYGKQANLGKRLDVNNPKHNIIIGTLALAGTKAYLEEKTGKVITDGDLFMAHMVGTYGAEKLLKGNPDAKISKYIATPKGNMRFYATKGKILTVKEFRAKMDNAVQLEKAKFQIAVNQHHLDDMFKQFQTAARKHTTSIVTAMTMHYENIA